MLCARVRRHRKKTHKFNSGMEQKKETERYKWCCDGSSLKICTFFYSQYIYFYLINFHLFSYFFIFYRLGWALLLQSLNVKFTPGEKITFFRSFLKILTIFNSLSEYFFLYDLIPMLCHIFKSNTKKSNL